MNDNKKRDKPCEFCEHSFSRHIIDGCVVTDCWCRRPGNPSIKKIGNEPVDHYVWKHYVKWFFERRLEVHHAEVEKVFTIYHKGEMIQFPVDVYAITKTGHQTAVNIDGGIHQHSKIQIGRTKNRDMSLSDHFKQLGIHYYVIPKEAFSMKLNFLSEPAFRVA